MYAVVEIAGRQYKVAQNDTIVVPTLQAKPGADVIFDRVLLLDSDRQVTVGHPFIAGARVQAKVLDPVKGEKVTVFKKKKRKGYRVKRGHRQGYSRVQVINIG
jgi:large subunit ribosomal protein L21